MHKLLGKKGVLITSVVDDHKHSESLMKEFADFELKYRSQKELKRLLSKAGFKCKTWKDEYNIHTIAVCRKK